MQEAVIVAGQVVIMFALILLGWILSKQKMIQEEAVSTLNSLVIYIAGPAIMIRSFNVSFSQEKLWDLLVCLVLSILVMASAIVVGRIFFRKTDAIAQYSVVFNNCGFIGIPLVQSVLGEEAIFYLTIFMAVWNLFAWTYGVKTLCKDNRYSSWKKILLNPATISVGIGMILFFTPLKLPALLDTTLNYLGNMNTPLAMLVLGHSVSKISLKAAAKNRQIWTISFFRLLAAPAAAFLLMFFLPYQYNVVRYTLLIAASTPVGAMLTMFLKMLGKDTSLGSAVVVFSTLLSLLTIPAVLFAAALFWG